jgi:hypothetical protein
MVAALDSSVIPQPSVKGGPSARKKAMISASSGAEPLTASAQSPRRLLN